VREKCDSFMISAQLQDTAVQLDNTERKMRAHCRRSKAVYKVAANWFACLKHLSLSITSEPLQARLARLLSKGCTKQQWFGFRESPDCLPFRRSTKSNYPDDEVSRRNGRGSPFISETALCIAGIQVLGHHIWMQVLNQKYLIALFVVDEFVDQVSRQEDSIASRRQSSRFTNGDVANWIV
jgi:hypothetical protein